MGSKLCTLGALSVALATAALGGGAWAAAPAKARAEPTHSRATRPAPVRKKPATKAAARKGTTDHAARPASRKARPMAKGAAPAAIAKAAPAARPRAAAPEQPLHWTRLPPSRFYPNGIPELRPEFLHPLPSQQPVQEANAPQKHPLLD